MKNDVKIDKNRKMQVEGHPDVPGELYYMEKYENYKHSFIVVGIFIPNNTQKYKPYMGIVRAKFYPKIRDWKVTKTATYPFPVSNAPKKYHKMLGVIIERIHEDYEKLFLPLAKMSQSSLLEELFDLS